RNQRQSQLASACLSLASVPPGGAWVLLPLPQSGSVTMELLALPSLADEDKPSEDSKFAKWPQFMRPLPETPQRPKRLSDRLSCADADCQGERRQISDYSYAKRYRDMATMEFQMSYKRRKASRSRSIADKVSRALQVRRSAQ
uniref:BZIP domain-containing protein n=1 Tax=Macrostomum lignano TaxID=282301 RepID=A0A1I8HGS6_9PLAT